MQPAGSTTNSDPNPTNPAGQPTEPTPTQVPAPKPKKSHHKKKPANGANGQRHPALDLLEVRDTLGLSPEFWETAKIAAYDAFGQFLDVPRARSALMVRGFDCLDQVAVALKVGKEIAENDCFPAEHRLLGAKIVALTTEAQVKMSEHLMELAEKGAKKAEETKKRNLPPQALAAQVNIYPAGSGAAKALNATAGQKDAVDVAMAGKPVLSLPEGQQGT